MRPSLASVEKVLRQRDIRDVRTPDVIRPGDLEAPEQIGEDPVLRGRDAGPRPPIRCLDPHPAPTHPDTLTPQVAHQLPAPVEGVLRVQLVEGEEAYWERIRQIERLRELGERVPPTKPTPQRSPRGPEHGGGIER